MIPPPIPSAARQSALAITALAFSLLGEALAAWVYFRGWNGSAITVVAIVAGLILAVIGTVLGLASLALRGVRRGAPVAASVVNGALIAAFLGLGAQVIPPYLRSLGEAARGFKKTAQASRTNGINAASDVIPQKPGAATFETIRPIYFRWVDEKLQAGYNAHGARNPRWDADARRFFTVSALAWFDAPDAPSLEERWALAQKTLASGCPDPLVAFLAAELTREQDGKAGLLTSAANNLQAAGYSPSLLFLARTDLLLVGKGSKGQLGSIDQAQLDECLLALRAALVERPLTADDCVVWNFLLNQPATIALRKARGVEECTILDRTPGIEEWLKHRVHGTYEIDLAWMMRGDGYANTVTAAGERGFEEHLAKARIELTRAWELNPANPSAASDMIRVSMGLGQVGDMRKWFDRAVTARFDFRPAYNALRNGLRPRWFGSQPALLAYGRGCANTGRYDTWVPWELLLAVRDQADDTPNVDAFYATAAPWSDLQQMFESYLREPSQAAHRAYFHSHYAIVAAKCGKTQECLDQLAAVEFHLELHAANEWRVDAAQWPGAILAKLAQPGQSPGRRSPPRTR